LVDFTIDLNESFFNPIEHIVIFESFGFEQTLKKTAEIYIVRLVIETQRPDVIDIRSEFVKEDAFVELFSKKLHFLLFNQLPFLLFNNGLKTLL